MLHDEIAIERALSGEPVRLTAAECDEAVARLTARGSSAQRICDLLHLSHRAVAPARRRAADLPAADGRSGHPPCSSLACLEVLPVVAVDAFGR